MEEKLDGKIYKITNLTNNKVYIGQTICDLKKRWIKHCSKSGCHAIRNAINKYGKNSFTIEKIDESNNFNDLNKKEIYWIEKNNSMCPNGYNLRKGGNRSPISEKTKEKIANTLRGRKRPESLRKKLSIARKGNSSRLGTGKKVYCVTNNTTYKSVKNISHNSVGNILSLYILISSVTV